MGRGKVRVGGLVSGWLIGWGGVGAEGCVWVGVGGKGGCWQMVPALGFGLDACGGVCVCFATDARIGGGDVCVRVCACVCICVCVCGCVLCV